MTPGKLSAQVAHAVKNLGTTPQDCSIVVLEASDKKFEEHIKAHPHCYVQIDQGRTEVEPGTRTTVAWIEDAPKIKYRMHRGGLSESMETVTEVSSMKELICVVEKQFDAKVVDLNIEFYGHDDRINWDSHIVTAKFDKEGYGRHSYYPVGFTNGMIK